MSENTNFDIYTPDSVIAAAVPFGREDPRDVAYNNAAYALDRDDVHLIYSVEGRYVYFIAAASEDFSGHPNAATPLSAALPAMKGHQGDGAYVTLSGSAYAVVVKRDQDMFSYVGDRQSVDAFIASHGVPSISVTENIVAPWEGYNLGSLRRAAHIAKIAIFSGLSVTAIAIGLWIWFGSQMNIAIDEVQAAQRKIDQSIDRVVKELGDFYVHPLQKDLQRMQEITALATEVGGWVRYFNIDQGSESWAVELPRWVTGEFIDRFGANLKVTRPEGSEYIVVEKEATNDRRKRR